MELTEKEENYVLHKEEFVKWHGWPREYKDYMVNLKNHKLPSTEKTPPIKALVNQRNFGLYIHKDDFGFLVELFEALNVYGEDIKL